MNRTNVEKDAFTNIGRGTIYILFMTSSQRFTQTARESLESLPGCEAGQIQCGGKIEDLSAFWKTISRVEQGWRDMISEMDQEKFAEVDRNNCALKLTQRKENRGK